MTSLPFMPLYYGDYLGDTRHLTTLQHGAYLLLLMHYWAHGELPKDDASLRRITGMTRWQWKHQQAVIKAFFTNDWKHKRADVELKKAVSLKSLKKPQSTGAKNCTPSGEISQSFQREISTPLQLQRKKDFLNGPKKKTAVAERLAKWEERSRAQLAERERLTAPDDPVERSRIITGFGKLRPNGKD